MKTARLDLISIERIGIILDREMLHCLKLACYYTSTDHMKASARLVYQAIENANLAKDFGVISSDDWNTIVNSLYMTSMLPISALDELSEPDYYSDMSEWC